MRSCYLELCGKEVPKKELNYVRKKKDYWILIDNQQYPLCMGQYMKAQLIWLAALELNQ